MQVRAKFRCDSVTQYQYASEVKLSAVYGTAGDNADFADATPGGTLTMMISKGRPAADVFTPGSEFYLTFTPAEEMAAVGAE